MRIYWNGAAAFSQVWLFLEIRFYAQVKLVSQVNLKKHYWLHNTLATHWLHNTLFGYKHYVNTLCPGRTGDLKKMQWIVIIDNDDCTIILPFDRLERKDELLKIVKTPFLT